MTQEKLAKRADLTSESVTRVERGVRMPTLKTLGKLAHGLGVSLAQLVDVGDVPAPKLSPSVAQIVSKLEDEEEHVQRGALEIVVAFMRALGSWPRASRRKH